MFESGVIAGGLFVPGCEGLRDLRSTAAGFLCPRTVDGGGAFCGFCFGGDILVVAKEKEGDDDQLLPPPPATIRQETAA